MSVYLRVLEKYSIDASANDELSLQRHPNLAFQPHFTRNHICSDLLPFEQLEKKNFVSIRTALLQLLHAVNHLHSNWKTDHGEISLKYVYITKMYTRLVLTLPKDWKHRESDVEVLISRDMPALYDLFNTLLRLCHHTSVLLEQNRELQHFLGLMRRNESSISLLKHPYFWSKQKMVNFLIDIAQFSKSNKGKPLKDLLDTPENFETICPRGNSWKPLLKLDFNEHCEVQDMYRRITSIRSNKGSISYNIIKKQAETTSATGKKNYDGQKVQSLVNFFRNKAEHYHEDGQKVQACFRFNKTDGLLAFFTERFPSLFITVYSVFCEYQKGICSSEIGELYFSVAANEDFASKD